MALFTAYFDASRSEDSRVTTVAGFVSRLTKWERFEDQWKSILSKANPNVSMFHMTDFVSSRNGWEAWKGKANTERRHVFFEQLLTCIAANTNKGFAASVPKENFNFKNSTHRLAETLGEEYAVCAFFCLGKLQYWAEKKQIDYRNILCMFEDGDLGQGDMISKARGYGFNAIPQRKVDIRCFDACDLAAWKARAIIDDAIYRRDITNPDAKQLLDASLTKLKRILHDNGWATPRALDGICLKLGIPKR
jgi:hypothetical protein